MSSDLLLANYARVQTVRDRNYSSLLRWAAYKEAQEIPATKPDETWVRERLTAESFSANPDNAVIQTLPYFLQDPAVVELVRDFLNAYNTDDLESQLSTRNAAIIGAFMPRYSARIPQDQVDSWYLSHGF